MRRRINVENVSLISTVNILYSVEKITCYVNRNMNGSYRQVINVTFIIRILSERIFLKILFHCIFRQQIKNAYKGGYVLY